MSPTCCSAGKAVTINGTGFTGNVSVSFGNPACGQTSAAAVFTVVSTTQLTATAPALPAGVADIQITNDAGATACSSSDQYTYSLPHVDGIDPTLGPSQGGGQITIKGGVGTAGFDDDPSAGTGKFNGQVLFGDRVACGPCPLVTNATVTNAILTNIPSHAAGPVTVRAVNSAGASPDNHPNDQFSYFAYRPAITQITPASGPISGGRQVAIHGANFTAATQVGFGSSAITCPSSACTLDSDSQVTVTSPAQANGDPSTVDVSVTTGGGRSAVDDGGCPAAPCAHFTFVAPPQINTVTPSSGPTWGGTHLTVSGSGFQGADQVAFGPRSSQPANRPSPRVPAASAPTRRVRPSC